VVVMQIRGGLTAGSFPGAPPWRHQSYTNYISKGWRAARSMQPLAPLRASAPMPSLSDAFFTSRRVQFATLAACHKIPAIYSTRDVSPPEG
jgi:hypothetical protein